MVVAPSLVQDCFHQVEQAAERIVRLDKTVDETVEQAPEEIREVIEALQALRGVAKITAATIVSDLGSSGLVPGEYSSDSRVSRGAVTKTGNAHLRRVIVEAAWAYQRRSWIGGYLAKRQCDLKMSKEVNAFAWKAQSRLHKRYTKLTSAGKNKNQTVTAVGRELLGLGYWSTGGSGLGAEAGCCSLRRTLITSMRNDVRIQPAQLVRGSSRRIMTMRHPTRVINRRDNSAAALCLASRARNELGLVLPLTGKTRPQPAKFPTEDQ